MRVIISWGGLKDGRKFKFGDGMKMNGLCEIIRFNFYNGNVIEETERYEFERIIQCFLFMGFFTGCGCNKYYKDFRMKIGKNSYREKYSLKVSEDVNKYLQSDENKRKVKFVHDLFIYNNF